MILMNTTHQLKNDFFTRWRIWGLSAFATALTPWQVKLTKMALISDWFQPELNIAASTVGPLFCLVTFAVLHSSSRAKKQRCAKLFLAAFVISLVSCMAFQLLLGRVWFPLPTTQMFVWISWIVFYLSIFGFFGITVVAATLAMPTPNNPTGAQQLH
jgi:hypothetical protein